MREMIKTALVNMPFTVDERMTEMLDGYMHLLLQANQQQNLTSITEPGEMIQKHILDSIAPVALGLIGQPGRLLDLGTGAGFPGMILAMLYPTLEYTLLDARKKRLAFLQDVLDAYPMPQVALLHARAEQIAHDSLYRAQYRYVTARAFAPLPMLLELGLPFVQTGGWLVAYTAQISPQDRQAAQQTAVALGGGQIEQHPARVPGLMHWLTRVQKLTDSPQRFPRSIRRIKHTPL